MESGFNGIDWESIGYLDFGNNQEYEVMVRKDRKREDKDFAHDQFPVFLLSHGRIRLGEAELDQWEPLTTFLAVLLREQRHHLNTVVIQLGQILAKY